LAKRKKEYWSVSFLIAKEAREVTEIDNIGIILIVSNLAPVKRRVSDKWRDIFWEGKGKESQGGGRVRDGRAEREGKYRWHGHYQGKLVPEITQS